MAFKASRRKSICLFKNKCNLLSTPNNDQMVDGLIFKFCESGKNLNRNDDIKHFKYAM